MAVINSMGREDWLKSNTTISHWTTRDQTGFHTYSDHFRRLYGNDYTFDSS